MLVAIGIWMHVYQDTLVYGVLFQNHPTDPVLVVNRFPAAFIGLGLVLTTIGFLGCCGACVESVCFLGSVSIALSILSCVCLFGCISIILYIVVIIIRPSSFVVVRRPSSSSLSLLWCQRWISVLQQPSHTSNSNSNSNLNLCSPLYTIPQLSSRALQKQSIKNLVIIGDIKDMGF